MGAGLLADSMKELGWSVASSRPPVCKRGGHEYRWVIPNHFERQFAVTGTKSGVVR